MTLIVSIVSKDKESGTEIIKPREFSFENIEELLIEDGEYLMVLKTNVRAYLDRVQITKESYSFIKEIRDIVSEKIGLSLEEDRSPIGIPYIAGTDYLNEEEKQTLNNLLQAISDRDYEDYQKRKGF